MKMFKITFTLLILLGLNSTVFAQTPKDDIKNMLEQRDVEIKELLGPKNSDYTNAQRDKLKDIVNGVIDFRAMAKYALEETYDTIETEEREEFVELFATIVRDQSLNKLDIYRAKVTYISISVNGTTADVSTFAELDDVRTPVSYTMALEDNEWVITDMIIDDVSTAEAYNRQFQRIINRRGFSSLLESLRKRAARA
ncbi:MAG: ABC transporter substrate-binding protein [Balneolaceae bacterium]